MIKESLIVRQINYRGNTFCSDARDTHLVPFITDVICALSYPESASKLASSVHIYTHISLFLFLSLSRSLSLSYISTMNHRLGPACDGRANHNFPRFPPARARCRWRGSPRDCVSVCKRDVLHVVACRTRSKRISPPRFFLVFSARARAFRNGRPAIIGPLRARVWDSRGKAAASTAGPTTRVHVHVHAPPLRRGAAALAHESGPDHAC